jgi:hypothetical protein
LAFNLWLGASTSFTSSCNSWKSQLQSRLQKIHNIFTSRFVIFSSVICISFSFNWISISFIWILI